MLACWSGFTLSFAVEQPPLLPTGWSVQGASRTLAPDLTIELIFAVKQSNVGMLHDTLMDVSTPASASYGKHLTNEAVHALVAPAADDLAAVKSYLTSNGIEAEAATPNSDMLRASVTLAKAEDLLGGKYMQLHHDKSGNTIHRLLESYHLPPRVASALDFVSPTVHVPGVTMSKRSSRTVEDRDEPN